MSADSENQGKWLDPKAAARLGDALNAALAVLRVCEQSLAWLVPTNPKYTHDGAEQDPCGIHGSLQRVRGVLALHDHEHHAQCPGCGLVLPGGTQS